MTGTHGSWWRHRGPRLVAVGELVVAAAFVIPNLWSRVLWLGFVALALVSLGQVGTHWHARRWWCELCADEAGPNIALELKALRRRKLLAYVHTVGSRWYTVFLLALIVVSFVVPGYPGQLIFAAVAAILAGNWFALDVHQRLALYCPFCGDDDDDDEDLEPEPEPDPAPGKVPVRGR